MTERHRQYLRNVQFGPGFLHLVIGRVKIPACQTDDAVVDLIQCLAELRESDFLDQTFLVLQAFEP